ncbi:protein PNO1 [Seminavis robusta]|uniref:Protein PNO1 n=1 Tax=Seminavis robusta TaxID=568900 RepID=A0A9N8DL77_9STRA|nr:protein PNO1 [Seminavis robusta]|eukprot:Sro203_g085730.1 protein PNO1 (252) ;mRNA; r:88216-89314
MMEDMEMTAEDGDNVEFSTNATTIDPSVISSRIRQSTSLQKEEQRMQDDTATSSDQPHFPKLSAVQASGNRVEYRRVRCPPHRYTPLREHWENILTPLVEYLKLQVRFNTKTRSVEMKTSPHTIDTGALQKGADFVSAFMLGFEVQDAVALLRLDDLYVESFQVTDVKLLRGDHLSRAIGRVAGQDGKTRFAIENATRTRIVVADQRIHLLGSFANLRVARNAICDLILGAPPGKVYNNMRNVAKRMLERY